MSRAVQLSRALAIWVAGGLLTSSIGLASADDAQSQTKVRVAAQKTPKSKAKSKRPAMETTETAEAPKADAATSFSRDVAPILVSNCITCHNPMLKAKRGNFDLTTFDKLMEGTPDEKVIVPGKPADSHLVRRIKGEETPKMPQGGNRNLSPTAIAKIEQWVKAGAVLDKGLDPKAEIKTFAASPDDIRKGELAKLSQSERDKKVEEAGLERWKKANPKVKPEVTPSDHFMLFGTLSKSRATAALKTVESQFGPVRTLLGPAAVDWGEKGSLFVFGDRASFLEFARAQGMPELELEDVGVVKLSGPEPYIAVIDPQGGRDESSAAPSSKRSRRTRGRDGAGGPGPTERSLAGLLTEQFVIGAAAKMGKPPRWLTLGLGAMYAANVESHGGYAQQLRHEAADLCARGWIPIANQALGDGSKPDDLRAIGYAILDCVVSSYDRQALAAFVKGMEAGQEKLDDVLGNVMNMTRQQFLAGSAQFVMQHYGAGQ